MSDQTAIKVDHISKTFRLPHDKNTSLKGAVLNFYRRKRTYEKQQVLNDVSFEIKKGEFFGIVGRNGSGKSTLLKLLAGIYSPSQGSIAINGKLTPFIELGVGFNPELTGRENVFLNGALLGFNRTEMNKMYKDIVEFAELENFMDQKLKNYSSGMQVRLAFSIAIRANTSILLLDEVLAVGDAAFQQKCIDYFKQLRRDKRTVILVSHDMATVETYCDRALLINNGVIIDEGDPKEITSKYRLLNLRKATELPKIPELFGEVNIEKVTINGNSQAIVSSSMELEVEIVYSSKKTTSVIVAVSICAADGSHIAYFDNREEEITIHKGKTNRAICKFMASQFLSGVYTLSVDIYDNNAIYLAKKHDIISFSVKGADPSRAGVLSLQGKWKTIET